jgi:hypothetical protein
LGVLVGKFLIHKAREWGIYINLADFGAWGSRGFMFEYLGKGLKNLHADRYIGAHMELGQLNVKELYKISGTNDHKEQRGCQGVAQGVA